MERLPPNFEMISSMTAQALFCTNFIHGSRNFGSYFWEFSQTRALRLIQSRSASPDMEVLSRTTQKGLNSLIVNFLQNR